MRQFTCRINNALHVVGGSEAAADCVVLMYNSHLEADHPPGGYYIVLAN